MKERGPKIVTLKQSISVSVALAYLEGLRNNACDLFYDDEYQKAFNALIKRVYDLSCMSMNGEKLNEDLEIINQYVIIEQILDK